MSGILYLCATPIGNLEDITLRVLRILKEADLIAAEDTRNTVKLLNHYGIKTPMTSYHEHNKKSKGEYLVEKLKEGKNIAVVTDAGMPGISDPGSDIARECYENGIEVTVLPGASAVLTGLCLSGLDTERYVFEGFLPSDRKKRKERLAELSGETRTIVLYEAPHRLAETLKSLMETLGSRNAACARELTKKFEEVRRGTLSELAEHYLENEAKGEFVLIIEGLPEEEKKEKEYRKWDALSVEEHMDIYISEGIDRKEAMKKVAKDRGMNKRDVYGILNN